MGMEIRETKRVPATQEGRGEKRPLIHTSRSGRGMMRRIIKCRAEGALKATAVPTSKKKELPRSLRKISATHLDVGAAV